LEEENEVKESEVKVITMVTNPSCRNSTVMLVAHLVVSQTQVVHWAVSLA